MPDENNKTEDSGVPLKSSNELAAERTDMAKGRTDMAGERTDLAVNRTVAAYDRTLIAWVRTAVSLISFGFTIYKFFQAFTEKGTDPSFGLLSPRKLGMLMLSMAVLSLLFATVQNHLQLKKLREMYPNVKIPFPVSIVLAILMALLALFLLMLAIFRQ